MIFQSNPGHASTMVCCGISGKQNKFYWIASIPATFMTSVTVTFIAMAKIGFNLSYDVALIVGIIGAFLAFAVFMCLYGVKKFTLETGKKTDS